MLFHMKTTLQIDAGVMRRLKQEAARQGKTMSELVDAALRRFLQQPKRPRPALPELPSFDAGVATVEVHDREALYDRMEDR
jgi:hypothetical protein